MNTKVFTLETHVTVLLYVVVITPLIFANGGGGGEFNSPACGPTSSFSSDLSSSAVTPVGSVHKSRSDNVMRMWVKLKR